MRRSVFGLGTLGFAALIFVAAIALQVFYRPPASAPAARTGRLANLLPRELAGWRSSDLPLGPNEAVRESAKELLRYDDYVYRSYFKSGGEFSVYVAHWQSGKMPTRLIAEHTPDRCWIENGWTCFARKSDSVVKVGEVALPPAEWRLFSPPEGSRKYHVLFWLLAGGRSYSFRTHGSVLSHAIAWWRGVMAESLSRGTEQLFVRVVSETPMEELARDPGFIAVMQALAKLGLAESGS